MSKRKSVIPLEDLWTGPRDDYVGRVLIRLNECKTWTSEKRRIYKDLLKELDVSRYSSFWVRLDVTYYLKLVSQASMLSPKTNVGILCLTGVK